MREAARRLGADPSAANYLALAREHVAAGKPQEVLRVCTEGLHGHAGEAGLARLAERARTLLNAQRIKVLQRDLTHAPRPALWRELCELQLEVGRLRRAEQSAEDWWESGGDLEALYFLALCRAEMFFRDRRAEGGQVAYDLALRAAVDSRVAPSALALAFEVTRRCGAWREARSALARLLELSPGDPDLEQRFRAVQASSLDAPSLERALREVERSGEFKAETAVSATAGDEVKARPLLQELGEAEGVRAAVYVRGGTALVQGPQGATADRTARGVREVLQSSRAVARRLGLGLPISVELAGSFGTLTVLPGERGTAAVWSGGELGDQEHELLGRLAGAPEGGLL